MAKQQPLRKKQSHKPKTDRLEKLSKTHAEKEKFYTQLRVLANARKLQPIIDKIMTNIYKLIDISEDPLFVEGKEEGIEVGTLKGVIKSIESMMINTDFDNESIARYLTVPLELVKKTRQNLSKQ